MSYVSAEVEMWSKFCCNILVSVVCVDSPVIIGGARCQHASDDAAAAECESEISASITGLAYTCNSLSTDMTSASSLPPLLTHGNDSVVRSVCSVLYFDVEIVIIIMMIIIVIIYTFLSQHNIISLDLATITDYRGHCCSLLPVREINLKACAPLILTNYLVHPGS